MSYLGGMFDANNVAPAGDMSPVPTGDYLAMVVDSDMKDTKNGQGKYLELVHEICDGPCKGRKVWARLNLVNANTTTVKIAQEHLSAICHATGIMQVQDSQQLHNRPMVIRVEFVPADGHRQTKDGNEIKAWKAIGGAMTAPAPILPVATTGYVAPAQAAPAVTPQAATSPPPWLERQVRAG